MAALPGIRVGIVLGNEPPLPPPPRLGYYHRVTCGWLRLLLTEGSKNMTLKVIPPIGRPARVRLEAFTQVRFWTVCARGCHAEAWDELIQYARNEGGLADLIDPHTEFWDGAHGHQPTGPGTPLPRTWTGEDQALRVVRV